MRLPITTDPGHLRDIAALLAASTAALDTALTTATTALAAISLPTAFTAADAAHHASAKTQSTLRAAVEDMGLTADAIRRAGDAYSDTDRRSADRQQAILGRDGTAW